MPALRRWAFGGEQESHVVANVGRVTSVIRILVAAIHPILQSRNRRLHILWRSCGGGWLWVKASSTVTQPRVDSSEYAIIRMSIALIQFYPGAGWRRIGRAGTHAPTVVRHCSHRGGWRRGDAFILSA